MANIKELADLFIRFGKELNELVEKEVEKEEVKNEKELLNEKEVIEKYAFFNKTALYRAVAYRGLKSYKINNHRYYKDSDIKEWIENQKIETPTPYIGF